MIGIVCSVKPVLTENLCVVEKKEEFSVTCYMCNMYSWRQAKHIHKKQTHFLSERTLHKEYYRKNSVEKILVLIVKGSWRQDELIGGKPLVVK
jgi:hypothetical protein